MLALEQFMAEAGEIRGKMFEPAERMVPIRELGFDSFAVTELLMMVEDMCDGVPYPAEGTEVLGWSLDDLYSAAATAAILQPLNDAP